MGLSVIPSGHANVFEAICTMGLAGWDGGVHSHGATIHRWDMDDLWMNYGWLICLVVDLPLWKIWKSIGMIISTIWKNKNVPNHQPVMDCLFMFFFNIMENPSKVDDLWFINGKIWSINGWWLGWPLFQDTFIWFKTSHLKVLMNRVRTVSFSHGLCSI